MAEHVESPRQGQASTDRGFTLVELLIVIVILGILATVTVLAVRGITNQGQENSEGADLHNIETGIEAYAALNGDTPTEAELVSGGFLRAESGLHDIVYASDGSYTIVNVRTGATVGSGQATTPATTTPETTAPETTAPETTIPPSNYNGWLGTPTTVAGLNAVTYGSGSPTILIVGGGNMQGEWNPMVAASAPLGATVTVVDVDQILDAGTARALATASLSYTSFLLWLADDPNVPVGGYGCAYDFLLYSSTVDRHPVYGNGGV